MQLKTKYETKYLESRHFLKASVLLVNMFKVVFIFLTAYLLFINLGPNKRLGYVCNPSSLKEGTETSRRRTDELGSRLERPIYFECKLNKPMHIGMQLLHPAATDHSVSISRRLVQCIFRFSLRSWAGIRPLSGGTGAVANWDPYQKATETAPSSVPWRPPVPLFFAAG